MEKETFKLSRGMKAVVACIIALFSWPIFFVVGNLILSIAFIEVSAGLLTVWGILDTVFIAVALGVYIDQEI